MKIKRFLFLAGTTGALLLGGCSDDPTDTPIAATDATTIPADDSPAPPADWAAQLVGAFATYDTARSDLEQDVGDRMSELDEPTEQQFFDVLADQMLGWADAGDEMTASLPSAVPSDLESSLHSTVDAHTDLVGDLRRAGTALRDGDPGPYNDLESGSLSVFLTACAELQFAILDLDGGLLACGIDGEDPAQRDFVEGPTVGDAEESLGFVDMPAGSYRIDYLGEAGFDPVVSIGLDYDTDLLIRTSIELVELAAADGPTMRIHASQLVANPLRLEASEIPDFWPLTGDPGPWIEALEGVAVVTSGTGEIGGLDARYWDLVSGRDEPIAVLGDGTGWVPETTLDPGQPVRLWWVTVGDGPLLITQHGLAGAGPDTFTDGFDALLAGLTLTAQ